MELGFNAAVLREKQTITFPKKIEDKVTSVRKPESQVHEIIIHLIQEQSLTSGILQVAAK
jgi:hypothetical protein